MTWPWAAAAAAADPARRPDPYGAAPNTFRFNAPLPAATLFKMLDGTYTTP